jgi:hypothetical protein
MLDGVVVYRVMSTEQRVFEQELVRRQRLQEAKLAARSSEDITSGGISKLVASIRALVRSASTSKQLPAGA